MSDYKAIFKSDNSQNWFRCSLAVRFVREGIVTFVQDEIKKMHHDILQNIAATNSLPPETTCTSCTTPNVLPCPTRGMCRGQRGRCSFHTAPIQACPNNLCWGVRQQIENEHRFHGPSWRNTNAQHWCGNSWEMAKCFMPPDGYSGIPVADATDFNGIINIIINCKRFESLFNDDLTRGNNICTRAREVGRNIRHSPNYEIDASTATNNFDILIKLLEDPLCLKFDTHAMEAKKKILELQAGTLAITTTDIAAVQEDKRKMEAELRQHEQLKLEFQQDVIKYYEKQKSCMPLSPLMTKVDEKLAKFFVTPKLSYLKCKTLQTFKQKRAKNKEITAYTDIFYRDNTKIQDIYIQGEAGMGKSTLCTHLTSMWCEIQKNDVPCGGAAEESSQIDGASDLSGITVLKDFDFLFLITLREVRNVYCHIEDMIKGQIVNKLVRKSKYGDEFIARVLDEEKCLIILDGLDEWSHPDNIDLVCQSESNSIPHRRLWENCTYITTTRPWKMNDMQLKDSEIGSELLIAGVDGSSSLTEKVCTCLNKKYNTTQDPEDIMKIIEEMELSHLMNIPIVLMQLICLWFEYGKLGKSKCEIYSKTIDMIFGRMGNKPAVGHTSSDRDTEMKLPACFNCTRHLERYRAFLISLSNLALHTLLSRNRSSTLVFEDTVLKTYLTPEEQQLALNIGILSQQKLESLIEPRSTYNFLHKTFQEFLTAMYIAMHPTDAVLNKVFDIYGTVGDVMDISEIFIFVCGMNDKMAETMSETISRKLTFEQETVTTDLLYVSEKIDNRKLETYESMIINGYNESINNGYNGPHLALEHIQHGQLLRSDTDSLKHLIDMNAGKLLTYVVWGKVVNVPIETIQETVTQNKGLSTLVLYFISSNNNMSLDLSGCEKLEQLHLGGTYNLDIKLGSCASRLVQCSMEYIVPESVEKSIMTAALLTGAPRLHTLAVKSYYTPDLLLQVLPTLTNLQTVYIVGTPIDDRHIRLPNSINHIVLYHVSMTYRSCRELVDTLTYMSHSVLCELKRCNVYPDEEYTALREYVSQSDLFQEIRNERVVEDQVGLGWGLFSFKTVHQVVHSHTDATHKVGER